jgi:hypothetical protein
VLTNRYNTASGQYILHVKISQRGPKYFSGTSTHAFIMALMLALFSPPVPTVLAN